MYIKMFYKTFLIFFGICLKYEKCFLILQSITLRENAPDHIENFIRDFRRILQKNNATKLKKNLIQNLISYLQPSICTSFFPHAQVLWRPQHNIAFKALLQDFDPIQYLRVSFCEYQDLYIFSKIYLKMNVKTNKKSIKI